MPTRTHTGNREASFVLPNGVRLYGGFPSGGAPWGNRDPGTHITTLSGDLARNDAVIENPADLADAPSRADNSHHVVTAAGTDPNTLLDGLVISGGNANVPAGNKMQAAGIFGLPPSDLTIRQCTIENNSAKLDIVGTPVGGGIHACNGTISRCIIRHNAAMGPCAAGGGLWNCDGTIEKCTITGNVSGKNGGGLYGCDGTINDCNISNNVSLSYGGGMDHCNGQIRGCTITGNRATNCGGGIYWSQASLVDCTIRDNMVIHDLGGCGGGLASCGGTLTRCIIGGNSAVGMAASGGGLWQCNVLMTQCTIAGNSAEYGGGGLDYCDLGLFDCSITGNSADDQGGALWQCTGKMENCLIAGNAAPRGAGLYDCSITMTSCDISENLGIAFDECLGALRDCRICDNASLAFYSCGNPVTDCIIRGNNEGGFSFCDGRVSNSIISNNRAPQGGGFFNCSGPITHCLITGNIAEDTGGGASFCTGSFTNCTMVGNMARRIYGGGMYYCTGLINNCIIRDNRALYWPDLSYCAVPTYSCLAGGGGAGCITGDPLFRRPGFWDPNGTPATLADDFWVEGDYHLSYDSPCIDAGDPNSDYSAEPIPNGRRIDIGAYGGTPQATKSMACMDLTGDYRIDLQDLSELAAVWDTDNPTADIAPSPDGDGRVDYGDLQLLAENWLEGAPSR